MADKLLLEDGTGFITLEDGSGHLLLEFSAAELSPKYRVRTRMGDGFLVEVGYHELGTEYFRDVCRPYAIRNRRWPSISAGSAAGGTPITSATANDLTLLGVG